MTPRPGRIFPNAIEPDFLVDALGLDLLTVVLFLFGLYRPWWEIGSMSWRPFQGDAFGSSCCFSSSSSTTRESADRSFRLLSHPRVYWLLMLGLVGGGALLHTLFRRLLIAGIGLRNTLIVGWQDKARALVDSLLQYPALGQDRVRPGRTRPARQHTGASWVGINALRSDRNDGGPRRDHRARLTITTACYRSSRRDGRPCR